MSPGELIDLERQFCEHLLEVVRPLIKSSSGQREKKNCQERERAEEEEEEDG